MIGNKIDKMLIMLKLAVGFAEVHYIILFFYMFQNFHNVNFFKNE